MNTFAKLDAMKEDYRDLLADAEAIGDRANSAGDLKPKDQAAFAIVTDKANELLAKIEKLESEENDRTARHVATMPDRPGGVVNTAPGRGGVRVFNRGDSFVDRFGKAPDTDSPVGEILRAMVAGEDRFTPESVKQFFATQLTSPDSSGGAMVPEQMSSQIIDLARAKMVTTMAGMTTYVLSAETYLLPTVVTDPSFATVAEGAQIAKSDAVFGQVVLNPKKIATIVEASNELLTSGIAVSARLEAILAASIARVQDDQILNGDGLTTNLTGLFIQPDIDKTSLTGPITRAAIDDAVLAIRNRNHEPTHVICSPASFHALASELGTTTDYLSAPQSSEGLTYVTSSVVADTELAVGDFSFYGIGQREQLRLELSRTGDGVAWSNDLTSYRAILRVDAAPTDASAMQIINGIT